jgi:hypothetical protein
VGDATDIGIARKARDAAAEVEQLRESNAALAAQLDAYRANMPGTALPDAKDTPHGWRCGNGHPSILVDSNKRKVTCRYCGAVLDAFTVLLEFATEERRFWNENEHAKREHDRVKAQTESMKEAIAAVHRERQRVECPRGCGAKIVADSCVTGGITAHDCYKRRAKDGKVPRFTEERWRAVVVDKATRWCDRVTATRSATEHGGNVEEFKGPIGDKAERAAERVAAFTKQEAERAAARPRRTRSPRT